MNFQGTEPLQRHAKKHRKLHRGAYGVVRLGALQQRILWSVEVVTLRVKLYGTVEAKATLAAWGVRWKPGAGDPDWGPAKRAAYSRALCRLEQRGLILRRNWRIPHSRRTTHVQLLPQGKVVA